MQRILIVILAIIIASCSEEKIIDNTVFKQKFLIASDEEQSALVVFDSQDGILENDIYLKNNGKKLQGNVNSIKEWGNLLFLIMTKDYVIEIVDKDEFKSVATIDFTASQIKPTNISFVNSTDSYISFENDSNIVLYDLYNFQIAKYIEVPMKSVDLVAASPYIYVTNQLDNQVSIIDSRTDEITKIFQVKPAPTFVDYTESYNKIAVVSLGDGKINENQKTGAYLSIIDAATQTKTSEILIKTGSLEASEIVPEDMIIAENYCFIITADYIFRYDIKNEPSQIQLLSKKNIKSMKYFPLRNKVIVLEGNNTFTYSNPYTLGAEYKYKLNINISSVHPL